MPEARDQKSAASEGNRRLDSIRVLEKPVSVSANPSCPILRLVGQVVTVSVETVRLVNSLPSLSK